MTMTLGKHSRPGDADEEQILRLHAGELSVRGKESAKKSAKVEPTATPLSDYDRDILEELSRTGTALGRINARVRLNRDNALRQRILDAANSEMRFDVPMLRETPTGFQGRGGGNMRVIERVSEWRGTTAQVAGLFPFAVGANAPMIGTPLGTHLETGQPAGFDPLSWYAAGLLTAPSAFVLALNGYGKSTLQRRIVIGDVAHGDVPLILGDIKPDYRTAIEHMGGQIIDLGWGAKSMNPLGVGALGQILHRVPRKAQDGVRLAVEARQVLVTASLLEMVRGSKIEDYEETMIAAGLRVLAKNPRFTPENPPLLQDLLNVFREGPDDLIEASGAYSGDATDPWGQRARDDYFALTLRLRQTLTAVIRGPFGSIFNAQTSEQLDITSGRPICIDISRVPEGNGKLRAATLLACWSEGFASIEAANTLADHDLGPQLNFHAVMDELARVLSTGGGVVDRVDELTRVQRTIGVATTMITHTIKDLGAFDSTAERAKALGFIERARAKVYGPIPPDEVSRLESVTKFTRKEAGQLSEWASGTNPIDDPAAPIHNTAAKFERRLPPGMGKFLIKTSESDQQPGIPIQTSVVRRETEVEMHATSKRFETKMAAAQ
ncbi:hypothetical protein [Tsukamurella spumae]|uniref:ATP-binding protein n=1 Tax=Tsukamurella spumae TaxID=44753 RepID=A0A846X6U1_9ACTN|nr:hypothetical protein [Tsukamurella spumae]NKY19490.1 hypothetical protein [Tsukamurella spumae]